MKGQAAVNLPPAADSVSPTGVSYKSGAFTVGGTVDLSIGGPGIAGLQLIRSYSSTGSPAISDMAYGQGWTFNMAGVVSRNKHVYPPDEILPPNPNLIPYMYTVSTGTKTVTFKGTGAAVPPLTNYTNLSVGGEKLVFTQVGNGGYSSGSYFTFTDSDGSVYIYPWGTNRLQSITYPDGTKLDFTGGTRSIISNRGYAILSDVSANKMCVVNMADTYVTAASICPAGAQSVTFTKQVSTPAYNPTLMNLTVVTNAIGGTTTYSYVGADHLGCIKDPGQTTCRIANTYNVCLPPPDSTPPNLRYSDQVISQVTGTGETYSYSYIHYGAYEYCSDYTGYGSTTTMVGPASAATTTTTNGAGALAFITDPLNRSTGYDYFEGTTAYQYETAIFGGAQMHEGNGYSLVRDSRGNITESWLQAKTGSGQPAVKIASASYPATCTNPKTCNKPDYSIDANGNRTDYAWDVNHGGVLTITMPAAAAGGVRPQKRFTYSQKYAWIKNSSGGFVQAATPVWMLMSTSECRTLASCANTADEIKTTNTYGTTGVGNNLLPTSISVGAGDNSLVATTSFTYDSIGNVLAVDGPLAGSADTTRYRYDGLRRLVGEVSADPDSSGVLKHRAIRKTYDPAGRLTKVEQGTVNSQSDVDWNAFVSLESVDTTYDVMGRVLKTTTSGGGTTFAVTQSSYDSAGRLDCVAQRMDPAQWSSQTNACVPQTTGTFGPDRITRLYYNAAGDLLRRRVGVGLGSPVEADEATSTYSNNARVGTVQDGEGNLTTYSYDAYDRPFKVTYADTSYEQTTVDFSGNVLTRRLRDGQLIDFTYDKLGRMVLKDLPSPETDVSYSSYDLQGNLLQMSQAFTIGFTFDALGRNRSETGPFGTVSFDFDLAGRRVQTTWPDGFFSTFDWYQTDEVREIQEHSSSGVSMLAQYTYDDRGNRVGIARGNGTTTAIVPDAISRLASLSHNLSLTGNDVASTFAYNPAGQLVTYTRDNDSYAWGGHYNLNRAYSVNTLNQVTFAGSTSLTYDGRGNLTTSGANVYTYSSENRLLAGPGGAAFQYDAAGRLYQSSKSGLTTRFLYDGLSLVAEYDEFGVLKRRYVHGPGSDEPLVWYEGSGFSDRRWYHQDERGSVIALSNGFGSSIATNTYDEFGVPGASNLGRFGYTGQAWLPEISQYYYKARIYNPSLGRFMQSDPVGYAAGMNLYSYVGGDPVNLVDPLGLDAQYYRAICWRCSADNIASESEPTRGNANRRNLRQSGIDKRLEENQEGGFGIDDAASIGVGCTPAGVYADVYAAIMGEDFITGEKVSGFWRLAGIVPFVSEARKVKNAVSAARTLKAISLPAWRKVGIDIAHVLERHTAQGALSPGRTIFPELMNQKGIERAIREAYRYGEKIRSQGDRVLMRGTSGGLTIEMWVNTATEMIETAYTVVR